MMKLSKAVQFFLVLALIFSDVVWAGQVPGAADVPDYPSILGIGFTWPTRPQIPSQ